jgi:hypothetical protein
LERQPKSIAFPEARPVCKGRFSKFAEICGPLAMVGFWLCHWGREFSIVNWEKSDYRSALADLSLECILHCKQSEEDFDLFQRSLERGAQIPNRNADEDPKKLHLGILDAREK